MQPSHAVPGPGGGGQTLKYFGPKGYLLSFCLLLDNKQALVKFINYGGYER